MKYIVDICLIIIFFLIVWLQKKEKMKTMTATIIKIIIVSIFIEFTIFNIKSYRFMFDIDREEKEYTSAQLEVNANKTEYTIRNAGEVKSVYLELEDKDAIPEYSIKYSDQTVSNSTLPAKRYVDGINSTKYTSVSFAGDVKSLTIVFSERQSIEKIVLNKYIPMSINILRITIVSAIIFIIYSLKTHKFWNEPFSEKNVIHAEILFITLAISILLCYFFCIYNGSENTDVYTKEFVESLANYQLALEVEPSEELLNLENPYDYSQRESLSDTENNLYGRPYLYDTALFNGKYYVYFGVLPAIILFLPFYLITKTYLLAKYGVFIFAIFTMVVASKLIKAIYLKWFKHIPFKLLEAAEIIFLFGIGIYSTITAPRFYEVIAMSGLFFAMFGVYFIITLEEHKYSKNMRLFWGCFSLALAVACRPTQLFTTLLVIPFIVNIIKQANELDKTKKEGKHRELIGTLAYVLVPYMFIGVILMNYNYARFGSPFDFGEKYQLTLYNAQESGLNWFTVIQGVITALFNLPLFKMEFPFVTSHQLSLPTYSHLYVEDVSAGLFFLSPICFMLFGIKRFIKQCHKESKSDKELLVLTINLLIVAIVVLAFTVAKAGFTVRYFLDFGWMIVLASIIMFFKNYESYHYAESKKILEKVIIIIACFTLVYNFLQGFNGDAYNRGIQRFNPMMFEKIKNMFMFWQ